MEQEYHELMQEYEATHPREINYECRITNYEHQILNSNIYPPPRNK